MLKRVAIKELVDTEEVGGLAIFICFEAANCITGSMLPIDCGWNTM